MLDYKPREELIALIQRQESDLAKSHDENETLKAEREAMTLQLAARQPLADSFVAPSVTVDTPEFRHMLELFQKREALPTVDQIIARADAHTARAVAAAVEKERASEMDTIRDRDQYHEWADKLADAIAKYFGRDIGEHSNVNCPWDEALDVIEEAEPIAAQPVAGELPPSRFGSPDLQAMIINRAAQPVQQPAAE